MKFLRKMVLKFLGIEGLVNTMFELSTNMQNIEFDLKTMREVFSTLSSQNDFLLKDTRALYKETESNIRNLKQNIKNIKPILKIEDEESKKFIKDILAKHDSKMNNASSYLESKKLELEGVEAIAKKASDTVKKDSRTLNNILNGLGLNEDNEVNMGTLHDLIKQVVLNKKTEEKTL